MKLISMIGKYDFLNIILTLSGLDVPSENFQKIEIDILKLFQFAQSSFLGYILI